MIFLILATIIVMFFMFPNLALKVLGISLCILILAGVLWVAWYLFIFALIVACVALVFCIVKKLFMIFFKGDDFKNYRHNKSYKKDDFIEVEVTNNDKK